MKEHGFLLDVSRETIVMKHSLRGPTFAFCGLVALGLQGVANLARAAEDPTASPQAAPSTQGAVSPANAGSQTTTVMVPQTQVMYETVYDVETVCVPVSTFQTQYRTECRTQTVPVTKTFVEQVPVTVNQTQYRTEYRTQTVPVTRTLVEQVPVTISQTQY